MMISCPAALLALCSAASLQHAPVRHAAPRLCASPDAPQRPPPVQVAAAATSVQQLLAADQSAISAALDCTVLGQAGSGHYGSVLLAVSHETGMNVAIKLSPHPSHTLGVEGAVLRALCGQPGFPEVHSFAERVGGSQLDALVMERLGPSLHDAWEASTASTFLPGPMVLRIGHGMLCCLRTLHAAGFVHNDVKPDNVLYGASGGPAEGVVHLIDFGLATGVDNAIGLGERGTPLFASAAAHDGLPTRPVHDVESLVYCLAYLAAGSLPWERKPARRAAFLKRKMLTDGCSTLVDSCASERLTEDVHAAETVEALQLVWQEVVAAQPENGAPLDYEACLRALGGGSA